MFDNNQYDGVTRTESCNLPAVRRVAAMLDLDPESITEGQPLPRGWQFILLGADTRKSDLRRDGFPGLGVPMPDLGLPRLLLGGRTVDYFQEIPVGALIKRASSIKNLTHKLGAAGPMAVVTIAHELFALGGFTPAIVETQTYLLLPAKNSATEPSSSDSLTVTAEKIKVIVPDETLLFQYSALGFNSHKIHIDKNYARDVEGFPELVVNGGLITLLLTEFLRNELELTPTSFKIKHIAPLYCGRPITLAAKLDMGVCRLTAHNDQGIIAAQMEVNIQ